MLSSKLLPEMEMDDNLKKEQLLHGMQNLPVLTQIEKLKVDKGCIFCYVSCSAFESILHLDVAFCRQGSI